MTTFEKFMLCFCFSFCATIVIGYIRKLFK